MRVEIKNWSVIFMIVLLSFFVLSPALSASQPVQVFLGVEGFPGPNSGSPKQIYKFPPAVVAALETIQANFLDLNGLNEKQNWMIFREVTGGIGDSEELKVLEDIHEKNLGKQDDLPPRFFGIPQRFIVRLAKLRDTITAVARQQVRVRSTYFQYSDAILGPKKCSSFEGKVTSLKTEKFKEKGKMPWWIGKSQLDFEIEANYLMTLWECSVDVKTPEGSISRIDWDLLKSKKAGVLSAALDEAFKKGWESDYNIIFKVGEEAQKAFELYKNRAGPFEESKKEGKCEMIDPENDYTDPLSGKRGEEESVDLKSAIITRIDQGLKIEIKTQGETAEASKKGSISYGVGFDQGNGRKNPISYRKGIDTLFILDVTDGKVMGFKEQYNPTTGKLEQGKWLPVAPQLEANSVIFTIRDVPGLSEEKKPLQARVYSSFVKGTVIEEDVMPDKGVQKCSY